MATGSAKTKDEIHWYTGGQTNNLKVLCGVDLGHCGIEKRESSSVNPVYCLNSWSWRDYIFENLECL